MPDWKDPSELSRDALFLTKLVHACLGCAVWESVSHLYYEWDTYRGKRPYRWTIWVYTCCRLSMIFAFMFDAIAMDGGTQHCTAVYMAAFASGYTSMGLASLLLVLRIAAVWQRHTVIVVISYIVWFSSVALNIHDVTQLRASYHVSERTCLPYKTHDFVINSTGILGSDTVLLVLMLAGILRVRRDTLEDGISRVLFRQGIIWLIVAIVVEMPVVVFAILDLNDSLVSMFQPVELLCLVFCAGRMYRGLMSYVYQPEMRIPLSTLDRAPRRLQPPIQFPVSLRSDRSQTSNSKTSPSPTESSCSLAKPPVIAEHIMTKYPAAIVCGK
ncbi:hypothetical protein PENSPDRAFT_343369 [Peniophora sp. CONT]|nr:hypothetical protein PENSPDRAFT_343369 [Peniophora sp. CONT]